MNVRCWFVKEFPLIIRERVMTFVDRHTASPVAHLEMVIHHPELAKALTRPSAPGADVHDAFEL